MVSASEKDSPCTSVVGEVKDLLSGTTAHAIGRTVTSERRSIRIMWAVLFGLATVGFSFHFSNITSYYLSYPISTTVAYKSVRFQFPDVTICNMLPISLHKLEKKDPELRRISQMRSHSEEEIEDELRQLLNGTENDKHSMFLTCSYNKQKCGPDNFSVISDPTFRACFTFSPQQEVRANSPEYGLNLIVYAENKHKHAIPDISFAVNEEWEASGIRLVIHEHNTHPHPELKGVNVQTGVNVRFAVTMERFKLYDIFRDGETRCDRDNLQQVAYCIENSNLTTRQFKEISEDCYTSAIQKFAFARCNCLSPTHDVPSEHCQSRAFNSSMICHEEPGSCYEKLMNELNTDFENLVVRKCKPTCEQVTYTKHMSSSDWPSHIAEKRVLNIVRKRHQELLDEGISSTLAEIINVNESDIEESELIKNNFLRITIYPEMLTGDEIVEELAYPFASFISEVGGILGLWMGASILTFLEPLQLLLNMATRMYAFCKRRQRQDKIAMRNITCTVDMQKDRRT